MWLNIISLQVPSLFGPCLPGNTHGTQIKTEQTLSRGYRFVLMAEFQELNIHLTTSGGVQMCTQTQFQNKTLSKITSVHQKNRPLNVKKKINQIPLCYPVTFNTKSWKDNKMVPEASRMNETLKPGGVNERWRGRGGAVHWGEWRWECVGIFKHTQADSITLWDRRRPEAHLEEPFYLLVLTVQRVSGGSLWVQLGLGQS